MTKLHAQRVEFEKGKFAPISNTDFEMDGDLVLLVMGFTGPVKNGLLDPGSGEIRITGFADYRRVAKNIF